MKLKNKHIVLILLAAGLILIVWNFISQPGIGDLKGNFKELAFARNGQNTGPVIRVYAVSLDPGNFEKEMLDYGNYMPYTKYGSTRVYFFSNKGPRPGQLSAEGEPFDKRFQESCIAVYQKDVLSRVTLLRDPFK